MAAPAAGPGRTYGVKIEAQFKVGEYEIVILSATDSAASTPGSRTTSTRSPQGAEPVLRPYVQSGTKFFVAKVDAAKKVKFKDDKAALSPLRFHYDTQLQPPVRLGLLNSNGPRTSSSTSWPATSATRSPTTRTSPSPPTSTWTSGVKDRFGRLLRRPLRRDPRSRTPAPSSPSTPGPRAPATPAPAPRSSPRTS
jgi:hypothetical protein